MLPDAHDAHDDHDDHDKTVTPIRSNNPHGKYMDNHVAKEYRMYPAEPDVRVLHKKQLKSYSADAYSGARILRETFDDNDNFLNISRM